MILFQLIIFASFSGVSLVLLFKLFPGDHLSPKDPIHKCAFIHRVLIDGSATSIYLNGLNISLLRRHSGQFLAIRTYTDEWNSHDSFLNGFITEGFWLS